MKINKNRNQFGEFVFGKPQLR